MVCLRNICINTLHKGDNDDDNNNNNNNNSFEFYMLSQQPWANYTFNTDYTYCVHKEHLERTHQIHYNDDDTNTAVCATKHVKFTLK